MFVFFTDFNSKIFKIGICKKTDIVKKMASRHVFFTGRYQTYNMMIHDKCSIKTWFFRESNGIFSPAEFNRKHRFRGVSDQILILFLKHPQRGCFRNKIWRKNAVTFPEKPVFDRTCVVNYHIVRL